MGQPGSVPIFFILVRERRGPISSSPCPRHTQARRPPSASALTFHGFVLMFTAGGLKSVLWRLKGRGVGSAGAPGWAGIPQVDVQSLESNLKSRPRGVMVAAWRWPTERGRQLCFYSECLLKSHVCRPLQTSLSWLSQPPVFVADSPVTCCRASSATQAYLLLYQ